MSAPVFETAPDPFRLNNLWRLGTAAHGPLRALPGRTRRILDRHTRKLDADGWADLPFPRLWDRGEPVCMAAASDGVVFVDGRGALWEVGDAGGLRRLAPPWGGLIGLYGDEIRLACDDAVSGRVVLWDGAGRRTWVFSERVWRRIDGPQPHGGESLVCPTPRGVYLLAGTYLWLLDADRWEPAAEAAAGWRANLLWWPPGQDGLWALSDDSIEVWTAEGPRPVPSPPPPATRRGSYYERTWDQVVSTGYDPVHNALLWYMEYEAVSAGSGFKIHAVPKEERTSVLCLDDCPLPSATLPQPRPGLFAGPSDGGSADDEWLRRSFYVIEFSIHLQGDQGFFYITADRDEVRDVLGGEQPPGTVETDEDGWAWWRYMFLGEGQTVCVWTVQEGVLAHGLDVVPYLTILDVDGPSHDYRDSPGEDFLDDDESPPRVALDWDAVSGKLPALRSPLGPPVNDVGVTDDSDPLDVVVVGPHPAPDIDTYLDFHLGIAAFTYGFNDL
jgi:hypothetical protein